MSIRPCGPGDLDAVGQVINDAAQAYRGVIPADRWSEPYMPSDEVRREVAAGVAFSGWFDGDRLVGVMGLQRVDDVALIRHAYVRTARQGQGIGAALLDALRRDVDVPLLVGTWRAATWAIRFYEKHGFRLVPEADKGRLLRRYWTVPERQIETSVVLADAAYTEIQPGDVA